MNSKKVIIFYDYFQVTGGAERVSIITNDLLKNSSIITSGIYKEFSYKNLNSSSQAIVICRYKFLPRIPRALLTFLTLDLKQFVAKVYIFSGIYAPLAAILKSKAKKIYYCHTLPKFAFQQYGYKFHNSLNFFKYIIHALIWVYRITYIHALSKMDKIICNSIFTQLSMKKIGFNSTLIYPPVEVNRFYWKLPTDYYLSVGRLEKNKRVNIILDAFKNMPDKKLIVASGGSLFEEYKSKYKNFHNIYFMGWCSDNQLANLFANCILSIYIPKYEDFGMSAVESLAAGKPVIGVNEGGLKEIIQDKVNGYLMDVNPTSRALEELIKNLKLDALINMKDDCQKSSIKFSSENYLNQLNNEIESICSYGNL